MIVLTSDLRNSGCVCRKSRIEVLNRSLSLLLGGSSDVVLKRGSKRVLDTSVHDVGHGFWTLLPHLCFILYVLFIFLYLFDFQFPSHSLIAFEKEVVCGCLVVVLVCSNVLLSVFLVESELLQKIQDVLVNRNVGNSSALLKNVDWRLHKVEPCVLLDVLCLVPLLRVCIKNALHEVSAVVAHELGDEEVPIENLLVKFSGVWIFERKVPAHKSKQDDSCTPNVYVSSMVPFASNHLRSSVTWGPTCRLEELPILVHVGKSKVYNLDCLVVVKKEILWLEISMDYVLQMEVIYS